MNIVERLEELCDVKALSLRLTENARVPVVAVGDLRILIEEIRHLEPLAYMLTNGEVSTSTTEIAVHDLQNSDKAIPLHNISK